jgi:hypothetical protein
MINYKDLNILKFMDLLLNQLNAFTQFEIVLEILMSLSLKVFIKFKY